MSSCKVQEEEEEEEEEHAVEGVVAEVPAVVVLRGVDDTRMQRSWRLPSPR
eukprot:CAMPEP_0118646050 /NCGR_PEP_ID=MMETSP0785-20121206/7836_1 /TAXON_ID=91992 /ORGANISM="Bolidomonas pacifica, Strain CCMP 1866" /LENGTH=50 /DNA_ID=CAMNT_0006537991 /DNA_START=171 /DNA_END=323 /DNA_ORIENTATION=-